MKEKLFVNGDVEVKMQDEIVMLEQKASIEIYRIRKTEKQLVFQIEANVVAGRGADCRSYPAVAFKIIKG